MAHDLVDKENHDPQSPMVQRLLNVKASRHMLSAAKRRAREDGLSPPLTNVKASRLSEKRAAATDPARNKEMFDRLGRFTVDLYQNGKITQPWW